MAFIQQLTSAQNQYMPPSSQRKQASDDNQLTILELSPAWTSLSEGLFTAFCHDKFFMPLWYSMLPSIIHYRSHANSLHHSCSILISTNFKHVLFTIMIEIYPNIVVISHQKYQLSTLKIEYLIKITCVLISINVSYERHNIVAVVLDIFLSLY